MSTDWNESCNGLEEICEVVKPYSSSVIPALKDCFSNSQDRRLRAILKMEAMKMRHEERMKILELIRELAEEEKLTGEMFGLLMIAFAG